MSTFQFQTHLNPNQTLTVPPEIVAKLTPDQAVQVVLKTSDDEEDDWRRLAAEQFLAGYAPGDDVYDQFPTG